MRAGAKPALFRNAALLGTLLTLLNTLIATGADAISKTLISTYAAPQLVFLAGLVAIAVILSIGRFKGYRAVFHSGAPAAMAGRAVASVVAVTCFFYAFRYLPFAEVFIFIGIMPCLAAVLSGLFLAERVSPRTWVALILGFVGLLCLFPSGLHSIQFGHLIGAMASLSGTVSIVLSRHICKRDTHSLAQVFYQQLANVVVMGLVLPQVAMAMPLRDVGLLVAYALLVFATRWLTVVAVRLLPAFIVMQIVNVQFLWMVILGKLLFGETTATYVYVGAGLVVLSGLYLAGAEIMGKIREKTPNSAADDLLDLLPRASKARADR